MLSIQITSNPDSPGPTEDYKATCRAGGKFYGHTGRSPAEAIGALLLLMRTAKVLGLWEGNDLDIRLDAGSEGRRPPGVVLHTPA